MEDLDVGIREGIIGILITHIDLMEVPILLEVQDGEAHHPLVEVHHLEDHLDHQVALLVVEGPQAVVEQEEVFRSIDEILYS